jgi:hypothetical protein
MKKVLKVSYHKKISLIFNKRSNAKNKFYHKLKMKNVLWDKQSKFKTVIII